MQYTSYRKCQFQFTHTASTYSCFHSSLNENMCVLGVFKDDILSILSLSSISLYLVRSTKTRHTDWALGWNSFTFPMTNRSFCVSVAPIDSAKYSRQIHEITLRSEEPELGTGVSMLVILKPWLICLQPPF